MPGGYYTALSGMRTRLDALDRLASDIANASTAGYKVERGATLQADRPSFDSLIQASIDVANGSTRLDRRSGALMPTGRALDVAVGGPGFLVLETSAGVRYTRDGRLMRREDGTLTTFEGDAVVGDSGPISVGTGNLAIDTDGTVREAGAVVGKLMVVEFGADAPLARESGSRIRNDGPDPVEVEKPSLTSGSLEQSNVSVVDRVAELTAVSRTFETLQRAVNVLMNDVDTRAIVELGRR